MVMHEYTCGRCTTYKVSSESNTAALKAISRHLYDWHGEK